MATTAELSILISAKDAASAQISGLGKALGGLGSAGKVATAGLKTVTTVGVALAAGIGASINAAMNFESAMSGVGAVSGASATELAALSAKALALGQDTTLAGIGATDAAAAMQALAAGGVSTQDILEGAAQGALLLASAGGIEVPRAADIAANALNQFGLAGNQAGHVADLLAAAANASSADVGDLGESLKFVGPIAKSMGLSIEDVVATLTEFGSQGIKGSMAGTALRSILSSLAKPSDQASAAMKKLGLSFFDSSGHMKNMEGISGELQGKLSGLTDQQRANTLVTLFGNEALSAATILYGEGAAGIQKYLTEVNVAGSAAESGAKRNDNLKGSIEQLKSSWETASITLGTAFLPAVRGVVDELAKGVNAAIPFIQKFGPELVDALTKGMSAAVGFGKNVAGGVMAVVGSLQQLATGQITLAQFIGGMQTFVSTIAANLGQLAAMAAPQIGAFFSAIGTAIATYAPQIVAQFQIWAGAFVNWITDTAIPFLTPKLGEFLAAIGGWITGSALPAIGIAAAQLGGALIGWVGGLIATVGEHLGPWKDAVVGWISGTAWPAVQTAAATLTTALVGWIRDTAIPALGEHIPFWIDALRSWIADSAVPTVQGAVIGIANALGDWVEGAATYLVGKLPVWGEALYGFITDEVVPTVQGKVIGLANALSDWVENTAVPQVKEQLPGLTAAVVAEIQHGQDQTNAPAEEWGNNLGKQIGAGMLKGGGEAIPAAVDHWQLLMVPPIITLAVVGFKLGTDVGLQVAKGIGDGGIKGLFIAIATFEITLFTALARIVAPASLVSFQIGAGIAESLRNALAQGFVAVFSFLASLPARLAGAVGNTANTLYQKGVDLVQGFINGIESKVGEAVAAAAGLANLLPGAVSDILKSRSPSKVMADIGNDVVMGLVKGMDDKQQEAAKKAADVASAIAKAITDTLTALTALGQLNLSKLPSGLQVSGFIGSLTAFMEQFATAVGGFKDAVLTQASGFADAAGKVVGLIKNGVEGLTAISKFTAPLDSAVSAFIASLTAFIARFSTAAGGFAQDVLADAVAFAEAAGKVGAAVGNALKGLQDLASADWAKSSPTGGAMSWFTHLTASLVQNFATAAKLFADDALAEASAFADAAGKVGGAVKNALDGLAGLATADWAKASPTGSAMGWFTHLTASLVQNFADASKLFADGALKAASDFAESAGKVVGTIGPAVQGLAAINTLVTPPQQAVDNLLRAIKYIVGQFAQMASTMSAEGIKNLTDFSNASDAAVKAAGDGINTFKGFDKLVVPSKKAIDDLLNAIHYVVDRFGDMADSLNTAGIARLQQFATAAGTALATAKTGTDLFKEMEKLVVPSKEAIDNLLAGIVYVVVQLGNVADQIGKDGLVKAQDFATGAKNVFDTVKAALDTVNSLKEYKDLPAAALRAIKLGLEDAIDEMRGRIGQSAALEQDADTFLGNMREAARKVAEGMALMGQAQAPGDGRNPLTLDPNYRQPINQIINAPQLAAGAIVRKPLLAMIGESGPEAVVPLGRRGMGGGTVVNINYPVLLGQSAETARQLAAIITPAQNRQIGYTVG